MLCVLIHTTSVRIKIRALTFYPNLDFVAKSQELDSVPKPIKIQAFSAVGSQDFDRQLCPVRALLQYCKTTSFPGCRKGRNKLFLSYKPSNTDEIKKIPISSWIVKLIRLVYGTEDLTPAPSNYKKCQHSKCGRCQLMLTCFVDCSKLILRLLPPRYVLSPRRHICHV